MIRRPAAWGALALLLVLAADQASKHWVLHGLALPDRGSVAVLPWLNFTLVWNHGVTFGLLNGFGRAGPLLLGSFAVAVVAVLAVSIWRAERFVTAVALGGICGGAIGNVIDRARFGAVVDFIHAHAGGWSWYVFNVADAAICLGVAALAAEGLLPARRKRPGPA